MPVLSVPVVLKPNESTPNALLLAPVESEYSASYPKAELKFPVGDTVSVTGLETCPRAATVDVLDGERVNEPKGSSIVRVALGEVLS